MAAIAAAPPSGGLSRCVPDNHRDVSIAALVPTGLARGKWVRILTHEGTVEGTLLSATSDPKKASPRPPPSEDGALSDGGADEAAVVPAAHSRAGTTDAGERNGSLSPFREQTRRRCSRPTAGQSSSGPGGTRREYELLSLFRRTGNRVRRVTVRSGGDLDGFTLGEAPGRDAFGGAVLALRPSSKRSDDSTGDRRWTFPPRGDATVTAGGELFVIGDRTSFAGSRRPKRRGEPRRHRGGNYLLTASRRSHMEWKLFADLAERAGGKRIPVDADPGHTVGDALEALFDEHPDLRDRVMDGDEVRDDINVMRNGVNVFVREDGLDTELDDGDELALFPPVSGG